MPFEHIVLPSAGSLAVAAVAAFIFILQIWLSSKRAEFRWSRWTAAASFATILYAMGIFLEYNAPKNPINRFGGLLEWTAVIFLVHSLYGLVLSRLNVPSRRYHFIAGPLHAMILVLLWSTHLFVSDQFVRRPFFTLETPFVEADLGPLGPLFMLYALGASINAVRLWLVRGKKKEMHSRAFVWGASFWILLGAHDAAVVIGLLPFQYVMEYGFLGFSAALLYGMFSDYLRTSDALKQSNNTLRKEMTLREQADEALRESEKKLRAAQSIANIGKWSWSIISGKAEWSDEVYEIFKAPHKEPSYEFAKSFVHPDDLDLWQNTVQKALEGQKAFSLDYRAVRSDGETIWVHNDTQAVSNEQGTLTRYEGTIQDITERKQAEEALRRSEYLLSEAVHITHVGAWEIDIVRRQCFLSDEFLRIHGLNDSTQTLEELMRLVHPEDIDQVAKALDKAMAGGMPYDLEHRIVQRDTGRVRWVLAHGIVMQDKDGKNVRMYGASQDITDQKQTLDRIERQIRELSIINDIARSVRSTLNLDEILTLSLDRILNIAKLEIGAIYLMDHESEELVLATYRGVSEEFPQEIRIVTIDEGLTGRMALTGESRLASDTTKNSKFMQPLLHLKDINNYTEIFIKSENKVQGIIYISSYNPYLLSDEEIQFFESIANYIGVAIENARLYEETKRAAEALKKSEALHKEAQRVARIGHWELDPDIGTPVWSEEIFRIFGLEPDEGEPSFTEHETYVQPEDWPLLDKAVRKAGSEGIPFDVVFRIVKPGGEIGWMHAIGTTRQDDKGHVTKLFGTAQDITDLKKAEEAVHEKTLETQYIADELDLIIENIPGIFFIKDTGNRFIRVNKFVADAFNMTKEKLKGTSCFDLFPYNLAQSYFEDDLEVIKSRQPKLNIDEKWETAYDTRWFNTCKIPYFNNIGEISGVIGISFDITDLKNMNKSLLESEEKYRSLVESTEDSIYLIDKDCNYLFMNRNHLQRFGLKLDNVVGRSYEEFHSQEEASEFREKIKQVLTTANSQRYIYESKRDKGHYLRTLIPVKDMHGNVTSVTVLSKDVTEMIQAEENLRQANEDLLREYSQRKRLSRRLIELLESDRRQTAMELHDHVGHTLTSLKMTLEMMQEPLRKDRPDLTAQIEYAQEQTLRVLRDIKEISHGLNPGTLETLGIVSSIRDLCNEIQRYADISIRFFTRNVPHRFSHHKELAVFRIAQEGITNVVKHARAKNVFVNLIHKGGSLFLSVEDDGGGFDPEAAMKSGEGMRPLGLLIMQERAVLLGGEFTVESQAGRGTRLMAEIPL